MVIKTPEGQGVINRSWLSGFLREIGLQHVKVGGGIKEKDKVQVHGGSEDQREVTLWRSQSGGVGAWDSQKVASPLFPLLLGFQPLLPGHKLQRAGGCSEVSGSC